jgi:hypothetical protein
VGISVKGGTVIEGGSISQEMRPEDKMAADSQNGDIITLSELRVPCLLGRLSTT